MLLFSLAVPITMSKLLVSQLRNQVISDIFQFCSFPPTYPLSFPGFQPHQIFFASRECHISHSKIFIMSLYLVFYQLTIYTSHKERCIFLNYPHNAQCNTYFVIPLTVYSTVHRLTKIMIQFTLNDYCYHFYALISVGPLKLISFSSAHLISGYGITCMD